MGDLGLLIAVFHQFIFLVVHSVLRLISIEHLLKPFHLLRSGKVFRFLRKLPLHPCKLFSSLGERELIELCQHTDDGNALRVSADLRKFRKAQEDVYGLLYDRKYNL